ncbi:MAG TPA: glycosyltransferase [Acidimicrobiales bacterium]|nr:glycosyltransferase [Acidimicrobiales bacterium]
MSRAPATIVIPVWNAWDLTRACLDSLRASLSPLDQVVVVDNGSTDGTAAGLRRYPWTEIITNAENRGFAPACNQGAAVARHPVIVFLNNDTVTPARWLDGLVAPMSDPTVVACGPRSNFVSGPQMVDPVPYPQDSMSAMRRFARTWRDEHRNQTTDVDRLVGFCLAVRTESFRAIDGFDEGYEVGGYEDDDLCLRLRTAGGRLVIAHESFVHHHGHATFDANGVSWAEQELLNRDRFVAKFVGRSDGPDQFKGPLVTACLIVRDEEENLPRCLESVRALVDEVVVYDTGSTDGTKEVARAAGAVLVEGYWDDDFGRARNDALAHCHGRWVLSIDADETLVGDVAGLRRRLESPVQPEGYVTFIESELGSGWNSMAVHAASRLFRRDVGRWVGRLHEQILGPGGRPLSLAHQPEVRLHHRGYTDSVMSERHKSQRNLALARSEVEALSQDPSVGNDELAYALVNLGRALFVEGHHTESVEHCARVLELTHYPTNRRVALRMGTDALLALERLDEADEWIARLRSEAQRPVAANILQARVELARGNNSEALALLGRIGRRETDDDNFEYRWEALAPLRARALAALGRHGEAADVLLEALSAGACDVHVATVIELLLRSGRECDELVAAVPADLVRPVLAQVMQMPAEPADAVLEAWWRAKPAELAPLAAAARVAERLPLIRTLEWSSRLRAKGLGDACPLLAVARDASRPGPDRVRAAAVAYGTFRDDRARDAMVAAMTQVAASDLVAVRAEVALLCPFMSEQELEPTS